MAKRLDVHTHFILVALTYGLRATCPRRHVGAVLTAENRIVSAGYNGAPPGAAHCEDIPGGPCLMYNGNCINTIHAEQNCFTRAREQGDTLYSTDAPCLACLKMALSHNKNIEIYFWRDYPDPARDIFVQEHNLASRLHRVDMFACYEIVQALVAHGDY